MKTELTKEIAKKKRTLKFLQKELTKINSPYMKLIGILSSQIEILKLKQQLYNNN